MHRRIGGKGGTWVLSVVIVLLGGCSFQSTLSGAECDRHGQRDDGRVCKNGYWVSNDAGGGDGGGSEACNERDDDGDGVVDEGCECQIEGTTEGVCAEPSVIDESGACAKPDDWTDEEGETGGCGDGLDNDCDGETDESCSCEPGAMDTCFSANPAKEGVGACESGMHQCTQAGKWGDCSGDVTPKDETETTCPNGVDDDCDGVADEGCPCDVNGGDPGGTEGICSEVTYDEQRNCRSPDGYLEPTDDESESDACEGRDNDCDGATDEGCDCAYDPDDDSKVDSDWSHSTGVCTGQVRDANGVCEEPTDFEPRTDDEASASNCDGLDNDCDGAVDEGCDCSMAGEGSTRDCYGGPKGTDGTGPCEKGTQTCTRSNNGRLTWGANCDGQTTPVPETCPAGSNDIDKNCNGVTNDGCACNYMGTDQGVCTGQVRDEKGNCREPFDYTDDEKGGSDCDGKDNDCDGTTDEGCPCNFDDNPKGVCGAGTRKDDGSCAKPDDFLGPGKEENGKWCDGKDNDCDGETDEDGCNCVNGLPQDCYTGPMGKAGVGICAFGTQTCEEGEWGDCQNDVMPGTEEAGCSSDGKDDDCDGVTDENCDCSFMGMDEGVCAGQTRDSQGNCQQPSAYESSEQTCDNDGVDNDCDGDTDYDDADCEKPPGENCSDNNECVTFCKGYNTGSGTEKRCVHRIFVTSQEWTGDLGGPSGANQKCKQLANAANLRGNWRALSSDSGGDANSRITLNARLYNMNRTKIANRESDLWDGSIVNEVVKDETGNDQKTEVWTGSDTSGVSTGTNCSDWTSNSDSESGTFGHSDKKNGEWINKGDRDCDKMAALYCINGQ